GKGQLIGGCCESLDKGRGRTYWKELEEGKGKSVFLERGEVQGDPMRFEETLRALGLMGIYDVVFGIVFRRPPTVVHQDAYHDILRLSSTEFHQVPLPIIG
ncbi:LD-carboxypeptidase, partial [Staphylococcus pseudintermedius]